MITRSMVKAAYKKNVFKLVTDDKFGIVCECGKKTFFIGGEEIEYYENPEDYIRDIPEEDIIDDIFDTLCDHIGDGIPMLEYAYYESVLCENGIKEIQYPDFDIIFGKAKALECRASECLPGNSHDYPFYFGKARGIIEGAAIALGVSYDELNSAYNKWWKEQK